MKTAGKIVIYSFDEDRKQIEVKLNEETVWLSQAQIVTLFESSKGNVSEHIKNILATKELEEISTVRKFRTVQLEGNRKVSRLITHYNLDLIISIGYRVNSKKGIAFRQWANKILKEYLIKGFSVNEKLLRERTQQLQELKNAVLLQEKVVVENHLNSDS